MKSIAKRLIEAGHPDIAQELSDVAAEYRSITEHPEFHTKLYKKAKSVLLDSNAAMGGNATDARNWAKGTLEYLVDFDKGGHVKDLDSKEKSRLKKSIRALQDYIKFTDKVSKLASGLTENL